MAAWRYEPYEVSVMGEDIPIPIPVFGHIETAVPPHMMPPVLRRSVNPLDDDSVDTTIAAPAAPYRIPFQFSRRDIVHQAALVLSTDEDDVREEAAWQRHINGPPGTGGCNGVLPADRVMQITNYPNQAPLGPLRRLLLGAAGSTPCVMRRRKQPSADGYRPVDICFASAAACAAAEDCRRHLFIHHSHNVLLVLRSEGILSRNNRNPVVEGMAFCRLAGKAQQQKKQAPKLAATLVVPTPTIFSGHGLHLTATQNVFASPTDGW